MHALWKATYNIFVVLSLLFDVKSAPSSVPPAASFYVSRIPDLHDDLSHNLHVYSGHLPSDPNRASASDIDVTAHLFFVMIKARRSADRERILFWFNGGPGCSSFDGLMMELGPWRIDGEGGLKTVQGGWDEYTTLVFVDQPAGTGYSYVATNNYVHEMADAAAQVVEFLKIFYEVFPDLKEMDMYIGGESYAGQYVPYIADAVLSSKLQVNLKGAAIGNGWIDARNQYPAYLEYAVKHGLIEEGSDLWKRSDELTRDCLNAYDQAKDTHGLELITIDICEQLLNTVAEGRRKNVDGQEICLNMYDVRLDDNYPACGMNWPKDLEDITPYLRRSDVKSAFHANAKAEAWVECSSRVGRELYNHNSPSSITLMPGLLESIPILLFAGDQDLICNYVGIENLIQDMTWNGMKGLGTVSTKSWFVSDAPVGTWVESRNLTYVKIFNSSHMAPYDVPDVAHDMILRFMGMDFSTINEGSATIPSRVGDDEKPMYVQVVPTSDTKLPIPAGKTPEQDKAMWEAYYNAGSAALVLVLVTLLIGLFLYFGRRRRLANNRFASEEETIPLNESIGLPISDEDNFSKGKKRAENTTVFDVGDSED